MPTNNLGNYIRERRMALGLSQEELARRMHGKVTQADISRLERGSILLPRRGRLNALASALEVTLGSLLVQSEWLTSEEVAQVDGFSMMEPFPSHPVADDMVEDLVQVRETLLSAIDRIGTLEARIKN